MTGPDETGPGPGAPRVGVIMGSVSDLPVMQAAADVLAEHGVAHEVRTVSAHRTPLEMVAYAQSAADRGLEVIIAGAGGAAHLPGMVASVTPLPVIGVPVKSSNSLDGWDSLLSIVQMPAGVPVATVSIGGARNAGLLAVRILAAGASTGASADTSADTEAQRLRQALDAFRADLRDQAHAKGAALRERRGG